MKTGKTLGYPLALGGAARLFPNMELAVTFVTFRAELLGTNTCYAETIVHPTPATGLKATRIFHGFDCPNGHRQ
jgi:hypothetical protein